MILGLVLLGMTVLNPTGGARTRGQVADERQARFERTWDEVRTIVAEFHAQLTRECAEAIGAAYARYSSRFQDSVADQIRAIFADAIRKKIFIPLEHVFFDLAVRGCKNDRAGLNALRACIDRRATRVVMFFATNRLFRKTYRSLQFVEEQVVEKGVRAVFVKSGVDTADATRWRQMLTNNASMDEFVVGMYAENIRAAHEGLLERRMVFGTISFGYTGEPISGPLTRRGQPRQRLIPDPVAGPWVRTVFRWYVLDHDSISEIVRRLNTDPTVPPPPKAPNHTWTHTAVRRLLRNSRYRGCWQYGVTETVWVSSKDYARQVVRKEPLKEVQIEELRLVPDDQWFAAQARLGQEVARMVGRKPRDGDGKSRPRVLNGLFYCPTHDRKLYVGGVHGKYMVCRDCHGLPADRRPLFSQLPRALALRKTCETLAALIRADTDLVGRVTAAFHRHAVELQAPDPGRATTLESRLIKRDRRIKFVLRNPGDTEADQAESEIELRRLRKERADDQAELDALRAAASRAVVIPSDDEVAALVSELMDVLVAAAGGAAIGTTGLIRELIDRMTGGRIDLEQAGEARAQRGWLRGRFPYRLVEAITGRLTGVAIAGAGDSTGEVVIDFRADPETVPADVVAAVTGMYEAGALEKQIARRLALARSTVTRILDGWDAARGVERPDGRTRRSGLSVKHTTAPPYQVLAEQVKTLADAGHAFGAIADELDIDRNTVTSAWAYWHEFRGLAVPDGRARRKALRLAALAATGQQPGGSTTGAPPTTSVETGPPGSGQPPGT